MRKLSLGKSGLEISALRLVQPMIASTPGTTKSTLREENLKSAEIEQAAAILASIGTAAAVIPMKGERNPAHLMATTGQ